MLTSFGAIKLFKTFYDNSLELFRFYNHNECTAPITKKEQVKIIVNVVESVM